MWVCISLSIYYIYYLYYIYNIFIIYIVDMNYIYIKYIWVLAKPSLRTLYVIFPIHVNFRIRSMCVLKAIIHRKKQIE